MSDLDMEWQADAACLSVRIFDSELGKTRPCTGDDFFFESRWLPHSDEYRDHVARLRAICGKCSVILQCRAFADDTDTRVGFWGGETAAERHERRFPRAERKAESMEPMKAPCRVGR
jgi:hypothetical protein